MATLRTNCREAIESLARIKSQPAPKYNKLGQWLTNGESTGWYYDNKDIDYILK